MSSSSPEPGVLRGDRAGTLTTARFDTDLRTQASVAPEVSAQLQAEAQAAGYAAGWAQGRREAEVAGQAERDRFAAMARDAVEEQAALAQRALRAVAGAAAALERRTVPVAAELEDA